MNIDKAIHVLEVEIEGWRLHPDETLPAVLRLSLEALKAIQRERNGKLYSVNRPLPGETTE